MKQGFIIGIGLIIAIGAQNAFILRQGITKKHVFSTALISSVADALLIILGVGGLGTIISQNEILLWIAKWGGFIFLLQYGFSSLRKGLLDIGENSYSLNNQPSSLKATIFASIGFSLLNPHVYLDTVVLIGSLGAQYPFPERWSFAIGASIASFVWFFALAYGATFLGPLVKHPKADRLINIFIGIIMWWIAFGLVV